MPKRVINKIKKIVFTGGHGASSAYEVIEEVRRQKKDWDLYWIGFINSIEGENSPTLSSIYFPKYKVKTYGIIAGRIQRNFTFWTIPSLLKIPLGFIHALFLIVKIRPDLVLSFGGFSAFPVVVVGYLFGVPVLIHEQTSVAGRANRLSSLFAKKIAISRETSRDFFPKKKTILTGNPISKDIVKGDTALPENPLIFVTGGQSGSVTINNCIASVLRGILHDFLVIHQTGLKDEKKFLDIRENLGRRKIKYEVYGIIDPKKFNRIFNRANRVISRAGANNVAKIIASQKLSILIPLPISYLNEQEKNALFAQQFSYSKILKQEDLTPVRLLKEIRFVFRHWDEIVGKLKKKVSPDINAAEKIVGLIHEELQ